MSSEGTAVVAVGAGVMVGGVALLAAGAIIGTGMLVAQGVMWCGKKMEENVEKARNEWISARQAAYAENRANVQDMPLFIADQAERIAAATAHLTLNTASTLPYRANDEAQKQLDATLARVRTALENARDTAQIKGETERELLTYQLKAEIEAARGLLAQEEIGRAEAALSGSEGEIRHALHVLQNAWQNISNAQTLSVHRERQVRQVLRAISTQLFAIDTMLRNAGRTQAASYASQKQEITDKVEEAQKLLDADPDRAHILAQEAQKAVRALTQAVSADTLSEWDQTRRKVISIQATLDTLAKMLQDAEAIKLVDEQRRRELSRRIAEAQSETQQLLQSASATPQAQLLQLDGRAAHLKTDVFRLVKTKQQGRIADVVATTLGELGFQSNDGNQPLVQENGDTLRIMAVRTGNTPGYRRDDKVVSFDISRNGDLAYDFSGYVGDACLSEAREVFSELRAKGIFILDSDAMQALSRLPVERLTPEKLARPSFNPQVAQNKTQAALAERLEEVLARMNFSNVQKSVNGGCYDVEAFNGKIGYHVILPSDGSVEVFKNHVDVSHKNDDLIVSELAQVVEEAPAKAQPDQKSKSRETWQDYMDTRQQQTLDH